MAFLARDQALCGALGAWEGKEFSLVPARPRSPPLNPSPPHRASLQAKRL